jgi:hypothetical protein
MALKKTTEWSRAYHEAGHALVAWRFGFFDKRKPTTIVADGKGAGGSTYHQRIVGRDIEWDLSPRNISRAEKAIQIALAGKIAQKMYSPRSVRSYHARSDHQGAVDLMIRLVQDEDRELRAWWKLLSIRTENLLKNPHVWFAVRRLAENLVLKKTISGKEALEIIEAAYGDSFKVSKKKPRLPTGVT